MSIPPELNVTQVLTGKRVLFAGATGFVGKVSLSMLLHRYGDVLGDTYVLVRKGSSPSAERRFYDKIVTSEPFQPLRDMYGGVDWLASFLGFVFALVAGAIFSAVAGLVAYQFSPLYRGLTFQFKV